MRIVIAPDKFKGSLTGNEFCRVVEDTIKQLRQDVEIVKLPMADGGDGTIEIINYYIKGKFRHLNVTDPYFEKVNAFYLYSGDSKIAFIEMAEASGLKILNRETLDCKKATSLGTGELIKDAIANGAQKIILAIGGSATNDCGIGMASALGFRFLDSTNKDVLPTGENLSNIRTIDSSNVLPALQEVQVEVACDVNNPLYGKNGAANVYAKQKGATQADIELLDRGLKDFSKVLDRTFNINSQEIKGAGAAGGMGIASKLFLNAELTSGVDLIKQLADFDEKIKGADWIITGEGKLDAQTLSGKAIKGIIESAKKTNAKVAVFCGDVNLKKSVLNENNISYIDSVMNRALNFNDAVENVKVYLREIATDFIVKNSI